MTRRSFLASTTLALVGVACGRDGGAPTEVDSTLSPPTDVSSTPTSAHPSSTSNAPPTTTAIPTTEPTSVAPVATTSPGNTGATLTILPRSEWRAAPAKASLLLPHSGPIQHLTVHHAGSQSGTVGPERFRSWQRFHMTERGWGDLAYHIIIGVGGDVFAGRDLGLRGDTATDYDPDRHFLVVVEGNFNDDLPTPQQLDSLRVVVAWASQTLGVPPDAVRGHADWAATSCPGDNLSPYVRAGLAADVQGILDEGVVTLVT